MRISRRQLAAVFSAHLACLGGCAGPASDADESDVDSTAEPEARSEALYSGIVDSLANSRVEVVQLASPMGTSPGGGFASWGFCTATLIAPQYFITASHCPNWNFTPSEPNGYITLTNTDGSAGQQVVIQRQWSFGAGYGTHDVAMGRLVWPVTEQQLGGSAIAQIHPIGAEGTPLVTLVGYGCDNNAVPPRGYGTKSRRTVNWPVPARVACQGDSGGPVFLGDIFNGHEIVSINSTDGSGAQGAPWQFKERIEQMIRQMESGMEPSTDRVGGDYWHETLPSGSTATTCRDRCTNDANCLAFSYVTSSRVCWYKNRTPDSTPNRGVVSGLSLRWVNGMDRVGGDFSDYNSPSAESCLADCARNGNCVAYNFNNGHCWLKSQSTGLVSCPTCNTGHRKGLEPSTDRPGRTFANVTANTSLQCATACVQNTNCRAWTFNATSRACSFKDRVTDPVAAGSNLTSGVRRGLDYLTDRVGGTYSDTSLGFPNPEICQTRCALDARCIAWAASRTRCYLKDSLRTLTASNEMTSGVKGLDTWTY